MTGANFLTPLSNTLKPYESIVAQSAQWLQIIQMLSPAIMLNSMRKAKSTQGIPAIWFLIGVVFSALGIRFGQILKDDASLNANLVGLALSLIYVTTYYYYVKSDEKSTEMKKIIGTIVFVGIILLYSQYEDPTKIEQRFGMILTCLLYVFFVLPILDTIKAFREKCTRHLPFAMIFTGTLVSLAWLLHGIIINSGFIILQNAVMLLISIIQLSLFLIYPSEPSPIDVKRAKGSSSGSKGKTKAKKSD